MKNIPAPQLNPLQKNPRKSARILVGSIAALVAFSTLPTRAATQIWDTDGNALNGQNGIITGVWNTSLPYWWDGVSTYGAWVNGNDAIFTGATYGNTAGIVNISGAVSANSVKFNSGNNYIIGGGALNLTGSAQIGGSNNGTINAPITSIVGLTKVDANTVTLQGYNTYTGATTISAGTLQVIDGVAGLSALSNVTLNGGILETADDLIRASGSAASQMQLTGGTTGFSAVTVQTILPGAPNRFNATNGVNAVVVAMGSLASPDALTWGTGSFTPGTLVLNGNGVWLDFRNSLDLNGAARTINSSVGDNANNVAIISGVITGGAGSGLTKTGTGRLAFSAANTYAGVTTISAGTLIMRNANALGITAVGNGTTVNSGGSLGLEGAIITAAEPLTINGSNTGALRNIAGNNNYTGPITLGSSATIHSSSGLLTLSSATAIDVASGRTLSLGNANSPDGTMRVQSPITGLGGVTRFGDGNNFVWLDPQGANNTYSGITIIGAANSPTQLRAVNGVGLSANSALQIGVNAGQSMLETSADFFRPLGTLAGQVKLAFTGGFAAVGPAIGVTGPLIKVGFGTDLPTAQATTATWDTANFFSGNRTFRLTSANTSANLEFVSPINLGSASGTNRIINLGGRANTLNNTQPMEFVNLSGGTTGTGNLNVFGDNGASAFNVVFSGVIAHTGTTGFGVGNMGGNMTVSGDNTMTGAVTINSNAANLTFGGVNINHPHALGNAANTVAIGNNYVIDNTSGATVTIDRAYPWTMGSVQFRGTNSLNLGTGVVGLNNDATFNVARNDLAIGGIISNSGGTRSMAKSGSGSLTLTGTNTWGGATKLFTMTGGTLNIGNNAVFGDANNTLTFNGGLLDNTTGAALTLASNYAQTWGGDFAFFTDAVTNNTHDIHLGTGTATSVRNVYVNGAGTVTIGGNIAGGQALVKTGKGTLILGGATNAQGSTTVNRGTLTLDYSTSNAPKLISGQALNLGGGTLNLSGSPVSPETVSSTNINNNGASTVNVASGTATLSMKAISRSAGATVNFTAASIATTDTNNLANASGILGGWATVGGTSWATSVNSGASTTPITAYASETLLDPTANLTGNTVNVKIADNSGALQLTGSNANQALSTLNIVSSTAPDSLDINGKTLTQYTNSAQNIGGLLISGTAGYEIKDTNVTPGQLGATGQELIVNQFNTGGLTISAKIVGTNTALTKAGSQTLTLTGANTYTGTTTIAAGTLQIGAGGAVGTLGTGSVIDNGVLSFNRTGSTTVANTISGYGDVSQSGPAGSTVILTANNTYTGNTIINSNTTLQIGNGTTAGTGQITQNNAGATGTALGRNNGVVNNSGTLIFNRSATATVDAQITGSGALTQIGVLNGTTVGVLALTGNGGLNNYTGPTTVTSGILRADHGIGLSAGSNLILNGGVWEANNNGGGFASYQIPMFRAGGSGAGQMQITGGTSGFSAGTINNTHVAFGSFANPEALTWGSGNFQPSTLVLNENTATKYLYFWNPVDLNGSARNVAVKAAFTAPGTTTFAYLNGVLSGTGGLTKSGVGLLALNAANTYTGVTTVSTGVLRADENAGLPGTTSAGGGSNLTLNGGVWESQFDMTRASGTGQGQMQITGGVSGFSANIPVAVNALNPMNVAFGSAASPESVQWGSATFNPGTFVLNTASANNKLNFISAIDLNGATRQIGSLATAYNLATPDDKTATISGVISGTGSTSALTMPTGYTGPIALTGSNTYEGTTTISSAMLVMRHANALGSTAVGTTVNSGGSLGLEGGIVTAAEPLSLNGTGSTGSAVGALRNLWGNNTYSGPITLAGNAVIQSDNGTLTLNSASAIDITSRTLTLGSGGTGNGNIIITSQITGTGTSGGITRNGDGKNFVWLNPTTPNTYSGTTIIGASNSPTYLRAIDGVGLSATSLLQIGQGNGRSVFETNGTFTRTLGNTAGQQQVNLQNGGGGAGFAAVNGDATIGFLVAGSGSLDPTDPLNKITWGSSFFNPTRFLLSDSNSNSNLTVVNAIDLGAGATRLIGSDIDYAIIDPSVTIALSGPISNTGAASNLQISAANGRKDPNIVFSGVISGNINLILGKESNNSDANWMGSATLSGDNTFTGYVRFGIWDSGDGRNIQYLNNQHALGAAANTVVIGNGNGQPITLDNTSGADIAFDRSYTYTNNYNGSLGGSSGGTDTVNFVGTYNLNMGPGSWTLGKTTNFFNVYKKSLTVSALLGAGQSVTVNNNGTNNYGVLAVIGNSTYNGTTSVKGGVFRADDGVGLPNTLSTNGGSYLNLNGGVWESAVNMARIGGTGQGQMQITGGTSGFSAYGAAVSVAFSATASIASPDSLQWGVANFNPGTLVLNEYTANNTLNFVNPVDFNGSQRPITVNAAPTFTSTMSGLLSGMGGSGLTKGGVGTLILTNSNTYDGATTVNAGILKLGATGDATNTPLGTTATGTTVSATGAALDLAGFTLGTAEALSITGTGLSASVGALTNSGGAAGYSGVVTIGTTGASIGGSGDIELSAGLATNANALTKVSANILTLSAGSSRTGATTISAGTINQTANNALGISNPILSIIPTTGTGLYNLTGAVTQTVGLLTLGGANGTTASIATGIGTLTMGGNLTYNATNNPNGATISGALNLGTTQKTLNIGNSTAAANDLTVTADVSAGVGGSILKTGLGSLSLNGDQGYNALTVNDGTTNLNGALSTLTAAVTVNDSGNGTILRIGSVSQTLSSLSIGAGATVIFTSGTATGSFSSDFKAPSGFASGGFGSAAVPEPGTIGLLLVGALGVLHRRKRPAGRVK